MSSESAGKRQSPGRVDLIWAIGLGVGVAVLYFVAAGLWGFWEPWETEFARMGRTLATGEGTSFVFPLGPGGELVNKPWLVALLLQWGYQLGGGSELGMRAPLAALGVLTVLATYGGLRVFTRPHRAGISALVLSTTPMFLMSAVNLAGAMPAMAVTSWALLAFAMAVVRRGGWWWLAISGVLTGLSLWAAGILGPILVLGTIACYGIWSISRTPGRLKGAKPILAIVVVGGGVAAYLVYLLVAHGFGESKNLLGVVLPLGLSLVAITAGSFTDGFRSLPAQDRGLGWLERLTRLFQKIPDQIDRRLAAMPRVSWGRKVLFGLAAFGGMLVTGVVWVLRLVLWPLRRPLVFGVGFLLLAGYPVYQFLRQQGLAETLEFLLYNDFLNRRSLADHVNFDTAIRNVGFAAFPYTALVPLGLAYLIQTLSPERGDRAGGSSDELERQPLVGLKAFLVCWFLLGFTIVGLTATLSRHYLFLGMVPMAVSVGLVVTDVGYWRSLRSNRSLFALIGFGCLGILLVLIKDLMTTANPELGQLGPEVLFEFLLVDGREPFPKVFRLPMVLLFGIIWVVAIAAYFWFIVSWLAELHDRARGWLKRVDDKPIAEVRGRRFGWIRRLTQGALVGLVMAATPFLGLVKLVLWPVNWLLSRSARRLLMTVLASCVLFAAVTAFAYLPGLSHHLSPRGLVDSYRSMAQPGEVLYRIGTSRASLNYYLGEDSIEIASGDENRIDNIRNISNLRDYFCDPSQRIFGMLDRDSMARAYYEVRRERSQEDAGPEGSGCDPDRDLWVVDGRSSRYVLISNQLHPERGEVNQNPISENVFEELPEGVIDMRTRYTFDGKLELVAYRVLDEDDRPISEASSGDHIYLETYWRVLERPTSAYQMFVHIDYHNNRINGDHHLVDGVFPVNYWVPGEIVRDRHRQQIDRGSSTGDYSIMVGFFSGDSRMEVRPATGDNRVQLGIIHIRGGL
ncbi:MAG: glycosyltransferase family 39 protein [Bradymonadales bacterium]|nr:glycosyltransferase family 39 protein [Bradymonadales bacterium]